MEGPKEKNEIYPDPNYKWRVLAGLFTILLVLIPATLIGTLSKSQSNVSIIFIFGLSLSIVLVVILVLFRNTTATDKDPSPKNLLVTIGIAITSELIASIVSAVLVLYLEGRLP